MPKKVRKIRNRETRKNSQVHYNINERTERFIKKLAMLVANMWWTVAKIQSLKCGEGHNCLPRKVGMLNFKHNSEIINREIRDEKQKNVTNNLLQWKISNQHIYTYGFQCMSKQNNRISSFIIRRESFQTKF